MELAQGVSELENRSTGSAIPHVDVQHLLPLREQDNFLPVANVFHLMVSELPSKGKVSKEAKILMQEMVSEFIGFVTSEANDTCLLQKQRVITHESILQALINLGMLRKWKRDSMS